MNLNKFWPICQSKQSLAQQPKKQNSFLLQTLFRNKIMLVHNSHYKRNYKYSHPLAGKLYDNERFVNHCSSYLDLQFKLSTTTADEPKSHKSHSAHKIQSRNEELKSKNTTFRVRYSQSAVDNGRLIQAVTKIFERQIDKSKGSSYQGKAVVQQRQNLMNFTSFNSNLKRNSLLEGKAFGKDLKISQRRSLKHKPAINLTKDGYVFPKINIRIINTISSMKEIEAQTISISFQKIFKKLIKSQLMGEFTAAFLQKLEQYITLIVESNKMYEKPLDVKLEQIYKTLSRKEQLLEAIYELQMEGQQSKIQQIIKYYCIPSVEASQNMLDNLLKGIVMQLYEKKNCPKNIQYCLLTECCQKITHISQIYFSTKFILIAPRINLQQSIQQYKKVLFDHDKQLRMTFKQSVKHNFMNKIVCNQVDEKMVNYTERPKQMNLYRKEIVEQAQSQLTTKSKKRLQQKRSTIGQSFLFSSNLNLSFTSPKDRLIYSYSQRKIQERKQYIQIITKLQKILDPNSKYYTKSKLDQKTEQQFIKLHRLNDQYDITYTHNEDNSNKLLLINLLQNCHIFNTKTAKQLERLLQMINKLYSNGRVPLKEIQFWQFKQIYQTAHGVSDQSTIMKFVLTYIRFDQFGQVSHGEVDKLVETAVSCKGRSLEMIKSIVWNWLHFFALIQNEVLRKQNLEIWFEPVKVVYLLFLSIMFGSEYKDLEQMRAQVQAKQFQ